MTMTSAGLDPFDSLKSCYGHNFVRILFNYALYWRETNTSSLLLELHLRSTNEFIPFEHFKMRENKPPL